MVDWRVHRTALLTMPVRAVAGIAAVAVLLAVASVAGTLAVGAQPDAHSAASPAEPPAESCRCAERSMAEYYRDATDVLVARLVAVENAAADTGSDRELHFELLEAPWRSSSSDARFAGATVTFATPTTTAECGIVGAVGATYIVFGNAGDRSATVGDAAARLPVVSSCTGTRVLRDAVGDTLNGFIDVPGRFVYAQLNALSGLDVLQQLAGSTPDDLDTLGQSLDATTSSPREGVRIGLLELAPIAAAGLPLHATPDTQSELLVTVRALAELEVREVAYEQPAAVVQARAGDWYRVPLRDGRAGWLRPPAGATWHPLESIVVARLSYLTDAWSGHVWPSPGAGNPQRVSLANADVPTKRRDEYPADVLETARVGGVLWLRVRLLASDPCEGGDGRSTGSGWIPAYGSGGRPTAWFYSRGC